MNKGHKCTECSRSFETAGGLQRHKTRMHSYKPALLPPPPPPARIIVSTGEIEEFRLLGGDHFDVGDVFWHIRKCVIKEITKTVGTSTVVVKVEVTKRHYQATQPF